MFNDVLFGYLSDRPKKFWSKYGRRFPWIAISIFPHIVIWLFLFIAPALDQLGLFFYFTAILIAVDTAFSSWSTNYESQFPDKFRSKKQRSKASGIGTLLGQIGVVIGVTLPPMFIEYGDISSYFMMAVIIGITCLISAVLAIPGVLEDAEMKEYAMKVSEKDDEKERASFFKTIKESVKYKNFLVFMFLWVMWQSALKIITTSFNYYNQYILTNDPKTLILIGMPQFLGSLLFIPLWVRLIRKIGARKIFIISGFGEAASVVFFLFASDVMMALIISLFMGAFIGGLYVCNNPLYSDCLDEIVVKTKERNEGIYFGIRTFFARTSFVIQAIVLVLIHDLTGFNATPGATQTPLAIFGIRMQIGLIPMLFIVIGFLVFLKFFDLKEEKMESIRKELKALNL